MLHPLTRALLEWYGANARDLPWRQTGDPYAIWVSEIMLQQTRAAAAIAAIAFGADTVALDGNLRRVLSRLFDLDEDPRSPRGEHKLLHMASAALPHGHAAAFNQALMDLGALVCTPRSPSCGRWPVAWGCPAPARGHVEA